MVLALSRDTRLGTGTVDWVSCSLARRRRRRGGAGQHGRRLWCRVERVPTDNTGGELEVRRLHTKISYTSHFALEMRAAAKQKVSVYMLKLTAILNLEQNGDMVVPG